MSFYVSLNWLVRKVGLDSLKEEYLAERFGKRRYENYLNRRRIHPILEEEIGKIDGLIEQIKLELYPLQEGEELWEWRNEVSEWEKGFGRGGYAVLSEDTIVRFIQTIMN
jgi:hypothetical protein